MPRRIHGKKGLGFDSEEFEKRERKAKREAALLLQTELSRDRFDTLLRNRDYASVCAIAKQVLEKTNLAYKIEKIQFKDAVLHNVGNQERFANVLFNLMYSPSEMETHFKKFCDLLSETGVSKWSVATYYQFLWSGREWIVAVLLRLDVRTSHEIAFVNWLVICLICLARLILPTIESVAGDRLWRL